MGRLDLDNQAYLLQPVPADEKPEELESSLQVSGGSLRFLLGGFFVLLCGLIILPFFAPYSEEGFANGYDTLIHFFKISQLKEAILEHGWCVDWNSRWYAGHHQYLFYPPLFYLLALGVELIVNDLEATSKILVAGGILFSGFTSYLLAMHALEKDNGIFKRWLAAVLGGLAYALSPALLSFIVTRGKYPDYYAIAISPLVLATVVKWTRSDRRHAPIGFTLGLSAVFLTHIDLGVTIGFASLIYVVSYIKRSLGKQGILFNPNFYRPVFRFCVSCVMAVLLTAWFWLPYIAQIKTLGGLDQLYPSRSPLPFAVFTRGHIINGVSRYPGLIALLLGLVFSLADRKLRYLAREWLVLFATGLALALLVYTPLGTRLPTINMLFYRSGVALAVMALSCLLAVSVKRLLTLDFKSFIYVSSSLLHKLLVAAAVGLLVLAVTATMIWDSSFILNRKVVGTAQPFRADQLGMVDAVRLAPVKNGGRLLIVAPATTNYTYLPALTGKDILNGYEAQTSLISTEVERIKKAIYEERSHEFFFTKLNHFNVQYILVNTRYKASELKALLKSGKFTVRFADDDHYLLEYHPAGFAQPIKPVLVVGNNQSYPIQILSSMPEAGFIKGGLFIDDYSYDDLAKYPMVVLYNFEARRVGAAEALLERYMRNGGKIVVAMDESLSNLFPDERFLGVKSTIGRFGTGGTVTTSSLPIRLVNFINSDDAWEAVYFDGLDKSLVVLDDRYPIVGTKRFGKGEALFVGYNLFFHSVYEDNRAEAALLREATVQLFKPDFADLKYSVIKNEPGETKLEFEIPKPTWILISMSWSPYWRGSLDGKGADTLPFEGLTALFMPVGRHVVDLRYGPTPIHLTGYAIAAAGLVALLWALAQKLEGRAQTTKSRRFRCAEERLIPLTAAVPQDGVPADD